MTTQYPTQPTIAMALALRAKIDKTHPLGFVKSLSNVPITIAEGIKYPRSWDLNDSDTDVGYLNSHNVTSMINHDGIRFYGNHTCSDVEDYRFEPVVRTAQFMRRSINEGSFQFIDQPLNPTLAKDIIRAINKKLAEMGSFGQLIGAKCWYNTELNSKELLMQGKLYIDYDYTPVPTLESLNLNQQLTDSYLLDFADLIRQAA